MRKYIVFMALMFTIVAFGQEDKEVDLFPANMEQYIGKVTREQFEEVVGEPNEELGDMITYNVVATYDKVTTTIWCTYRNNRLISVRFPTPHYLGYWMGFAMGVKGFPKKQKTAERLGMWKSYKDFFGRIYRVDLKIRKFGMQILDIKRHRAYSTAVINYHIVK